MGMASMGMNLETSLGVREARPGAQESCGAISGAVSRAGKLVRGRRAGGLGEFSAGLGSRGILSTWKCTVVMLAQLCGHTFENHRFVLLKGGLDGT